MDELTRKTDFCKRLVNYAVRFNIYHTIDTLFSGFLASPPDRWFCVPVISGFSFLLCAGHPHFPVATLVRADSAEPALGL